MSSGLILEVGINQHREQSGCRVCGGRFDGRSLLVPSARVHRHRANIFELRAQMWRISSSFEQPGLCQCAEKNVEYEGIGGRAGCFV